MTQYRQKRPTLVEAARFLDVTTDVMSMLTPLLLRKGHRLTYWLNTKNELQIRVTTGDDSVIIWEVTLAQGDWLVAMEDWGDLFVMSDDQFGSTYTVVESKARER